MIDIKQNIIHICHHTISLFTYMWSRKIYPNPAGYQKLVTSAFFSHTLTIGYLMLAGMYKVNFNHNTQKPSRDYLWSTQHVALSSNRPTLSIATERLACLNNFCIVQLVTLTYYTVGPGTEPRSTQVYIFLHPPFIFFAPSLPRTPWKC